MRDILLEFWVNVQTNLFKPMLLFFFMGFFAPVLGVDLEFPHILYQGLTIFLLVAIGWHGGEELAKLSASELGRAGGFMVIGFVTNFLIGYTAYQYLKRCTKLRRLDAAAVSGYYGSDSAGTFATATGVLLSAKIAYAAYMPVMLAVMEIPGCLLALLLVSLLREGGMDSDGNMPDELESAPAREPAPLGAGTHEHRRGQRDEAALARMALEEREDLSASQEMERRETAGRRRRVLSPELFHEVFLNPGIYLLLCGIAIGFIAQRQGSQVTKDDDAFFLTLFPGLLCLFLLEMGMTASRKLRDLKTAGWPFIAFGLVAPNVFATAGIFVAHGYSLFLGEAFDIGTYVLFSVLCGSASYIAVPAVQRLAIPEASPTLPLAASLGLTFTYNVTIGIPVYIQVAKVVTRSFPVT